MVLPDSFLVNTSLHNITVLDIWVCHLESAFYSAATTSVRLRQSGSLNGLIWTNASAKDLPQNSISFNITVLVSNLSALEGPTACLCCEQGNWVVVDSCYFVPLNHSIALITRCLGIFTLVPAHIGTFQLPSPTKQTRRLKLLQPAICTSVPCCSAHWPRLGPLSSPLGRWKAQPRSCSSRAICRATSNSSNYCGK